jgi:squalene cyclase
MRRFTLLAATVLLGAGPSQAADLPKRDPVIVDAKTEEVIKGALRWLASTQLPNGSWGTSGMEKQHPTAMTGYVLMAFQAAGQLPGEGEFGKTVSSGVDYLLGSLSPEGLYANRSSGQYMYGHGIATIALAELYGSSKSPTMRAKVDKAIRLIISAQNREGGWRYRPVASDADISVTVLQVVALRAAKNAGLDVPQQTIDNAVGYVRRCQHPSTGGFCYQPGQSPGYARTAAAIYSLQVCGIYDDEMVRRGAEYLLKNTKEREKWFTYGSFYAAPALYMIGGEQWRTWYGQMKEMFLKNVTKRGDEYYWEPKLDQGNDGVGPTYATSVYTMILAMPYHYIPLYQR